MTSGVSESISRVGRRFATAGLVLAVLLAPALSTAQAQPAAKFKVLHKFNNTDGAFPWNSSGGVIMDKAGNLYGTTQSGGKLSECDGSWGAQFGCGVVFKLSPTGQETVLHKFTEGAGGEFPRDSLVRDKHGNFYGTTGGGGDLSGYCIFLLPGCGVVFKLSPSGKYTVLHRFTGFDDGGFPSSNLILDSDGNLYGATWEGGASPNCEGVGNGNGCGVVFKLDSSGNNFTVLYNFTNGSDGATPNSLIRDDAGNLYGTTIGFSGVASVGTVFKLAPNGTLTTLYIFPSSRTNGGYPQAPVVMGKDGNLYGTTGIGGDLTGGCGYFGGCGTVFKLDRAGKLTVVHSFDGTDGMAPVAPVIFDASGNLYGTTDRGGQLSLCEDFGCGVVFKIDTHGKYTVVHQFTDAENDGAQPLGALLIGPNNELYTTTLTGGDSGPAACQSINSDWAGNGCGTVVRLTP